MLLKEAKAGIYDITLSRLGGMYVVKAKKGRDTVLQGIYRDEEEAQRVMQSKVIHYTEVSKEYEGV